MTTLMNTAPIPSETVAVRGTRVLPRAAAFWLVAATTATLLAASSAPSPLYPVYQAEFGFSALTLTAIFAVYVLALLLSLLTVGRLSDFLGRRPVLATALVVQAAAMAVFLDAHGVPSLFAARIVQGVATGAAIGVVGAYLLDLQPATGSRLGSLVNSAAATGGLGLGAVLAGVLLQYGPHPTRLVFAILTAAFLALAVATGVLPETVTPKPGVRDALRPQVFVPAAARRAFARAVPVMGSSWMLGGLMLSVGGSLLTVVLGQHNHAVVGLVIGLFAGSGAVTSILLQHRTPVTMSRLGTALLLVGAAFVVAAIATTSLTLFVLGAVLAGSGFGPAFLGAFRTVSQLAEPHERAALISAIFVVSYLAFSIPALVAGVLITHIGLRETSLGYAVVVGAVAVGALVYELLSDEMSTSS
ncbi:MAG TPA: MFS transporter [Jatrophihabitantaceae bacterium]|nr:MFS transporter [Jatrophihabitantaceae bacterium]